MHNTPEKQRPYCTVKSLDGSIELPIWRNQTDEGKIHFSVSEPVRNYRDKKSDEYKSTKTIFDRDLTEVMELYREARERIRGYRQEDYESRKAERQQAA